MMYVKQEKSTLLFFPLFWTILYDCYIPTQTLKNNAATLPVILRMKIQFMWSLSDTPVDEILNKRETARNLTPPFVTRAS